MKRIDGWSRKIKARETISATIRQERALNEVEKETILERWLSRPIRSITRHWQIVD
jgi:hypothetical protein